jgi:hypothetical protein
MGDKVEFLIKDARSLSAGDVNEDVYGFSEQAMWLLDGATSVSDDSRTPGPTDAAWFANEATEALSILFSKQRCLSLIISELEVGLRERYFQLPNTESVDDRHLPTTCLAIARLDPYARMIDVACLGDVSFLVQRPDGTTLRYADDATAAFGERTLRAWRASRRRGADAETSREFARKASLENREMVNRAGGYWVLHPRCPACDIFAYRSMSAHIFSWYRTDSIAWSMCIR